MRTYLTRLTTTAAGAVLAGVSLTGVAHAGEGDDNTFLDPSVLEDMPSLEPCHEVTASEDMVLTPIDPNEPHTPLPPGEIELPCFQLPTDPGDGDDGDDDGDDGGNGGDDGGDDGGNGGGDDGDNGAAGGGGGDNNGGDDDGDGQSTQGGGGSSGQPNVQPSGDSNDGAGDEGFGESTDDATPQQDVVTPTAATDGGDGGTLMLAVLAGVLGTAGLLLLIFGLRKRPRGQQPAR